MDGPEWIERCRKGVIARATRWWARRVSALHPMLLVGATVVGLACVHVVCFVLDLGVAGQVISILALVLAGIGLGFWLGDREGVGLAQRVCDLGRKLWHMLVLRPIVPERAAKAADRDHLVAGRVAALDGEHLDAPLSGLRCLAFGLHGRAGHQVVDDGEMIPFLVVTDDSEEVLVAPPPAEVSLARVRPSRIDDTGADRVGAFLRSRGIDHHLTPLRLSEWCLCDGDRVRVRGVATDRPDPGDEVRTFRHVPRARVFLDDPDHPLIIEPCG